MKSKKIWLVGLVLVVIVSIIGVRFFSYSKDEDNNIPEDYIAVFNGGVGEVTYSTYIYKIDNGHANYGFKYINTTNTTVSWGSSEWKSKVTGRGEVTWTDEVFSVAKKNGAYSYVMLPNDSKTYTIEEFQIMFTMD